MTATDGTEQARGPGAVLVTGGASGLGAAVALAVRAAGGRPSVLDLVAPPFDVDHQLVDLADRNVATCPACSRSKHPPVATTVPPRARTTAISA